MYIAGRNNPKIKLFFKLSASKKARQETGLFVLEGARLCADALNEWKSGKLNIYAAFASETALEKYADYIDLNLFSDEKSGKFFIVEENLCNKMSETQASQGIFMIAKMCNKALHPDCIKPDGKYLIMNNLQDPGNVGTILRTCDAVGIDGVVMTNNSCDLYNPKVIRSAMGSIFRLNVYTYSNFAETNEMFKSRGVKTMAAVIDKDAVSLDHVDFSGGTAVVIGNEGNGLSHEDAVLCNERITIKMHGNINSLNAAMAAGIILWEMTSRSEQNE